jgi:hypothetical protein
MRYARAATSNDYRMSMHLILVAPGLLAQSPQALAAARSLAMLAQLSAAPRVQSLGIAAALVAALGAAADTPVAPLAALGGGIDPGDDYVSAAEPVFLAADRDDLVLIKRIDDLAVNEASTLVAMLNRHFDADDLRFVLARPDAWFVRCVNAPDIVTAPLDAACGRGVYPYLPRGVDGGTWKRWQNEIGMLLHEHPINAAREANGMAPVTGIWFWGGGRLGNVAPLSATAVTAAPGRVGDLARGVAWHGGGTAHTLEPDDTTLRVIERAASRSAGDKRQPAVVVGVLEAVDRETGVLALESRWLAPALALLSRQRIDTLSFLADGNGTAARWTAARPTLWRRVIASVHRKPFAAPVPLES